MKAQALYALTMVAIAPCWGGTDLEQSCIVVPGIAVDDVTPDSLAIDFELESASDSFDEGTAKARDVAVSLESIAPPMDGIVLTVSRDLTFLQQKRATRGTKQQHQFRLVVDRIPDGHAEEALVAIVQSALTRVDDLAVTGFEARLSDHRTQQLQLTLLKDAIADSRELAATAAAEANLTVKSVRSMRIGGLGDSARPYGLEELMIAGRYYQNVQTFKLRDTLTSRIRVSVSVVVEYECERN